MKRRFGLLQRILFALAGRLAYAIIRLYYVSVRIVNSPTLQRVVNSTSHRPGIYPFWHAHQLSLLSHLGRTGAAILVSRSRDGEYVARIAAAAGFRPVRGSTSRGGAEGLKRLIEEARHGRAVAITPDGPRGPRHRVQRGVIAVARNSGRPIRPLAVGLSDFWEVPSWDRFRIPKPFAVGYVVIGEAVRVPPDADEAEMDAAARRLEERMRSLEAEADAVARRLRRSRGRVDLPAGH